MEEDSQIDGKVMKLVSKCKKEIVGNKVEGRISKRMFQENKAHQIL